MPGRVTHMVFESGRSGTFLTPDALSIAAGNGGLVHDDNIGDLK